MPYLPTAVGSGCGSRPPGHCGWQAMSRPAGMGSGGDFRSPISTRACACSCAAPRQLPVLLPLPHCASLPFREPRLAVSVPQTLKATSPLAAPKPRCELGARRHMHGPPALHRTPQDTDPRDSAHRTTTALRAFHGVFGCVVCSPRALYSPRTCGQMRPPRTPGNRQPHLS